MVSQLFQQTHENDNQDSLEDTERERHLGKVFVLFPEELSMTLGFEYLVAAF